MSNVKNQGRLRNGRCLVAGFVWAGALLIVGIGGCTRFNEYVAPPTIVDASKHTKSKRPAYKPISKEQAPAASQPERPKPEFDRASALPQQSHAARGHADRIGR